MATMSKGQGETSDGGHDDRLARFLAEYVKDYDALEVLLLLRDGPEHLWSPSEVATKRGVSPSTCLACLEGLRRRGLLVRTAQSRLFRYGPRTAELEANVERLANAYRDHPLVVMQVMTRNAVERVRLSALQRFATIFGLRNRQQ